MNEQSIAITNFEEQFSKTRKIPKWQLIIGFILSGLLMIGSTWSVLLLISPWISPESFDVLIQYSSSISVGIFLASVIITIVAAAVCVLIIHKPKYALFIASIHRKLKRGEGFYFLSPKPKDQSWNEVFRRSIYGSILVVGIALAILSFQMIGAANPPLETLRFGFYVMIASVVILPLTMMQFYYSPWLLKDAGYFHIDPPDRSFTNVGDRIEDILEFFAGIDIILVWIELTISTDLWVALFVFLVLFGPLFSIVLNFTMVYMLAQKRATLAVMRTLTEDYKIPNVIESSEEVREEILSLVEITIQQEITDYLSPPTTSEPVSEESFGESRGAIDENEEVTHEEDEGSNETFDKID